MQLSVKALSLAAGITFSLAMLVGGLFALVWPEWGARFMGFAASLYPGVEGVGLGPAIVTALYALIDGAVFGAVLAWLYNRFNAPAAADVGPAAQTGV